MFSDVEGFKLETHSCALQFMSIWFTYFNTPNYFQGSGLNIFFGPVLIKIIPLADIPSKNLSKLVLSASTILVYVGTIKY